MKVQRWLSGCYPGFGSFLSGREDLFILFRRVCPRAFGSVCGFVLFVVEKDVCPCPFEGWEFSVEVLGSFLFYFIHDENTFCT